MVALPHALVIGYFSPIVQAASFRSRTQHLAFAAFTAFHLSYAWWLIALLFVGAPLTLLAPFQVLHWYNGLLGGIVALLFAVLSAHWSNPATPLARTRKAWLTVFIAVPIIFVVLVPVSIVCMSATLTVLTR
jgi:hypothetical protein